MHHYHLWQTWPLLILLSLISFIIMMKPSLFETYLTDILCEAEALKICYTFTWSRYFCLMELKVHCHIQKSLPLVLVPSRMNPVRIISPISLRSILISSNLCLGLPSCYLQVCQLKCMHFIKWMLLV
jgi:hypothetical protein